MKTRIGGELVYPNAQNTVLRGSHRRFAWPKIHDQGSSKHFSYGFGARLYPLSEEEGVGYDHRQSATER